MRDIINLLENLLDESSSNLAPSQILARPGRFETFIKHIQTGQPFYTQNKEVIVDPTEAERFLQLKADNKFAGGLKARGTDGIDYPLSSFQKTAEFGGEAQKPGASEADVGKESAGLKPTQIAITDQNIAAGKLGSVIINNPKLQQTFYGRAVIECAKQIIAGQPATLPPEVLAKEKITAAIVDYAGEYLGVLALVANQTNFPDRNAFLVWLGGSLENLTLNFPAKANNNIADSFATIINPTTSHEINISSKGSGGGAAPALSGLPVPDSLRKKKKYQTALKLIDICKNSSTTVQPFEALNLLESIAPGAIPEKFKPFMPFTSDIIKKVDNARLKKSPLPEYESMWSDIKFRSVGATDAGKLIYAIKKAVVAIANQGHVPELQSTILEILDYNFVQQYTNLNKNTLVFNTQWPAKLNGVVTMENKSSAGDPTGGGFSFKLGQKEVNEESTELVLSTPEVVPERPKNNIKKYGRPFQR